MPIEVHNTLGRRREEFTPGKPGEVTLYVCGPTVYRELHIGNFRAFVVFDTVARYLEYRGYRVHRVQNFTDIDDKMINRARELGIGVPELAQRYIEVYFADADALRVRRAEVHPRATEHIPEILELCRVLQDKGHAYQVGGDLYFAADSFPGYGKLSGQNLAQLEAGARVEVDERKRRPVDFALWKAQKPGEPAWDSPWGKGRPGWHIECSAMAMRYLGHPVDIHAGGADLIFPHHENEIAQSEAATDGPFVRYWMHNGYLNLEGRKMSKSLGNVLTVSELRHSFSPEEIRFFLISAHYRSPLNYSPELLQAAAGGLERLRTVLMRLGELHAQAGEAPTEADQAFRERLAAARQEFEAAMDADFNTADALAALFELTREVNQRLSTANSRPLLQEVAALYRELGGVLGLLEEERTEELDSDLQRLVQARERARAARDWAEADRIRAQLRDRGVVLEDTAQGVRWKRSRS